MGPSKKAPTQKAARRAEHTCFPTNDRDRLFCERWLVHFDKDRAFKEAGFKISQGFHKRSLTKLAKFAEYLRPLREAKAKVLAQRLAVDGDKVLQGMVTKAFFDPAQFIERAAAPLTTTIGRGRHKKPAPLLWNGQPVYGERMKPYSELTPEQQSVVEITGEVGGQIRYRLPSIREQHLYLTSLGRQFGLFAEKLILERHTHSHMHASLSFEKVPSQRLESITHQLLPLVDVEFARSLGYTPEEVQAAAQEQGVLMPEKAPA